MSSPILSPQFRTCIDFFVIFTDISGEPVTTDVSIDTTVSFNDFESVDSLNAETKVLKASIDGVTLFVASPILADVSGVGVVLRLENRILFVVTFFFASVVSFGSHAGTD